MMQQYTSMHCIDKYYYKYRNYE